MRAAQRYTDVVISGLAHVDAPHVVTSTEIESRIAGTMQRLGVEPGLLESLTGIVERRFPDLSTLPSQMSAQAGELALSRSGVDRGEIGVLVNTSVTRDFLEPSTASIVHGRMGLPTEAANFDLGNACLGFLNGMNVVSSMIEHGEIDHGIVVGAENTRVVVEATLERLASEDCDTTTFREQFATLTLGSGAVAMVLSRLGESDSDSRFHGGLGRASTGHWDLCTGYAHEMRTDTKGLLTAGLDLAGTMFKEALATFEWDPAAYDTFVLHQVSKVHTKAVCDTLGLEIERFPLIYPLHGNIGPAGVPTALSKAVEQGVVTSGDRLMLMGVGSGINAALAEVVW